MNKKNWKGNLLTLEMGAWKTPPPPPGRGEGGETSAPPPSPPLPKENIMEIVYLLCQMRFRIKQFYIEFQKESMN